MSHSELEPLEKMQPPPNVIYDEFKRRLSLNIRASLPQPESENFMHRYPMEEAPGALSENAEFYKRMALVMLACQMRNPSGPAFYRDQPIVRDHIAAERAPYFIDICLATHPPSGQVTDPVIQFGWDYYKNGDIIAQLRRECTDAVLTCEADAYESMNDFGDYTNDANKWYPLLVDYLTSTAFLVRLEMLNRYDGTAVIAIWHWRMKLYVIYRHVTASDVKKPLEVISILWTTICQSVPDPVDDTMKTAVREMYKQLCEMALPERPAPGHLHFMKVFVDHLVGYCEDPQDSIKPTTEFVNGLCDKIGMKK